MDAFAIKRNRDADCTLALRCVDLWKTFEVFTEAVSWRLLLGLRKQDGPKVTALKNVNLGVSRGSILGILGSNGAGKSTLLRTLAGVYSPTAGTIEINGALAGLFELGGTGHRYITGREFAQRLLRFQGVKAGTIASLIDEIEEFSELGDYFDRRIHTYSSGMAARLYFAVATAVQHDLYLIDEILSVGDEHFQAKSWRRIRERLTNGASGVLVTHDWSAILRLCENSCILDHGRATATGRTDQIVVEYLGLTLPEATTARFLPLAQPVRAVSGVDCSINLNFEVVAPANVAFAYSIEMLRVGVGWDILLLSKSESVATLPGRYRLLLEIPKLPVAPGTYTLNLFLSEVAPGPSGLAPLRSLDIRSWTYGNGIALEVSGEPSGSAVELSCAWLVDE